ncbi:hypothetical protein [Clostridium sp.]|uniref:hypothetical protein n=1 Tax=Clostridium sp. TaxID=1506 RepID=UPI002FDEDE89
MSNLLIWSTFDFLSSIKFAIKKKVDSTLVSCDAWFLVFLAVVLSLAFAVEAGLAVWCVVYKGKHFTGAWNWSLSGVSINVECK